MFAGEQQNGGRGVILALSILVGLLGLSGCRTPNLEVERRTAEVQAEWVEAVARQSDLPEATLSWEEARERMLRDNARLQESRMTLTNSQKAVRQVFRDLRPSLNFRTTLSRRFADLPTTTVDDISFSADSFLNLPGLVNFSARLFGAKLQRLRAEAAVQLTEREATIELYKLFLGARALPEAARDEAALKARAEITGLLEPGLESVVERAAADLAFGGERMKEEMRRRIGALLGNRGSDWRLRPDTLPALNYDRAPLDLSDTNRVAELQLKLTAIELAGALAQLRGIKLRYWPDLNVFVTGPPLFQQSGGVERVWDAAQIRLHASAFWRIDTRGTVALQLDQLKRRQKLERRSIELEAEETIDRLLFAQWHVRQLRDQLERVEAQLTALRLLPPPVQIRDIEQFYGEQRDLARRRQKLEAEIAEVNTLFWFFDEDAWRDAREDGEARNTASPK
jgi:hypothetical protein